MNSWTLTFIDKKEEEAQQTAVTNKFINVFYIMVFVTSSILALQFILLFSASIGYSSWVNYIFAGMIPLFLLISWLLKRYNWIKTLEFFLFISSLVYLAQFMQWLAREWSESETGLKSFTVHSIVMSSALLGGQIQWQKVFLIFMQFKWYFQIFIELIIIGYFVGLIFNGKETPFEIKNLLWRFYVLAQVTGFDIAMSYFIEKIYKFQFHQTYTKTQQLESFKHILMDIIPISVVVMKKVKSNDSEDYEIIFHNSATKGLLEIDSPEEEQLKRLLKERLLKVSIDKNFKEELLANDISLMHDLVQSHTELSPKTPVESIEKGECQTITIKNVLEILSQMVGENKFVDRTGHFLQENTGNIEPRKIWLEIKAAKINWEGEDAMILCLNNVANFKEVDEYKSNILANFSHRLKSPLHAINANIEFLRETVKEKPYKKLIKSANHALSLLNYTVSDILNQSLILEQKLRIVHEEVPLSKLQVDAIRLSKFQAKLKNLQFEFQLSPTLMPETVVYTDPQACRQILFNLLSNAFKFTNKGTIKLKIGEFKGKYIEFEIEDSGVGILPENIPRLFSFQKNYKSNDSSFNIQGACIGLIISNHLAKLLSEHQREYIKYLIGIQVESVENKGSRFQFVIQTKANNINGANFLDPSIIEVKKRRQSKNSVADEISSNCIIFKKIYLLGENESSDKEAQICENSLQSCEKKALIVDDEPFCLDVGKKFLIRMGIKNLQYAGNGQEAVDLVRQNLSNSVQFDVILMDCNMPVLNGLEATKQILELYKNSGEPNKAVKIIGITANVSTADETLCRNAGMHYYFSKPLAFPKFEKILNEIIK